MLSASATCSATCGSSARRAPVHMPRQRSPIPAIYQPTADSRFAAAAGVISPPTSAARRAMPTYPTSATAISASVWRCSWARSVSLFADRQRAMHTLEVALPVLDLDCERSAGEALDRLSQLQFPAIARQRGKLGAKILASRDAVHREIGDDGKAAWVQTRVGVSHADEDPRERLI